MESHFTEQIENVKPTQSAQVSHKNSSFQPELHSHEQHDEYSNSFSESSNTPPQNPSPEQGPPLEINEIEKDSRHHFTYPLLLQNFNELTQHSSYLEELLRSKDSELTVFRENESYMRTELGSLQQNYSRKELENQNLLREVENFKNTTVLKELHDEVLEQNRTIAENNEKLSQEIEELLKETKQIRLVKAEGGRLLLENGKLKQDLEEVNEKLQKEEVKRMEVHTKWRNLANFELQLLEKIKILEKIVENHQQKAKGLQEEQTTLNEGNKLQIEELNCELVGAKTQIIQLSSQLKSSSEQFNLLNDKCQELRAKVEELNIENQRLTAKVFGFQEEKKALENERDVVSSQLSARCEEQKKELQRKSNFVSSLECLLEKAEDDLEQEKTMAKRLKEQIEELEQKTIQVQKTNEELSLIVEGQDVESNDKTNLINQQEILISGLKAEKLQLEKEIKEKDKKMDEKDKIIKGESFRVQLLSSQLQKDQLDCVEVKKELDKEKTQNDEKQKEIQELGEILKKNEKESEQQGKFIKKLQKVIEGRDIEIRKGKRNIASLLREKSNLQAKFRSEAWEETKLKLLRKNKILLRRERVKATEVVELGHLLQKKLGELNQANETLAALNTQISGMEKDSQTCIIELCVELQRLKSNNEHLSKKVNQGKYYLVKEVSDNDNDSELPQTLGNFLKPCDEPQRREHQVDCSGSDDHEDDCASLWKRLRLE